MEKINIEKHIEYFENLRKMMPEQAHGSYMTVLFFIISGHDILGVLDRINKKEMIDWVYTQQNSEVPNAGFRPNPSTILPESSKWDYASIASTYSALSILKILGDDYSRVSKPEIIQSISYQISQNGCVSSHPGSVENDIRFVYCLCAICYLLNSWENINKDLIFSFISSCQSYDGSFSISPGLEGHGGATYCAVSSLYLLDKLNKIHKKEELIEWLVMRQGTGFSGRPGKAEDTRYGYWIGLSLQILGAEEFVNKEENIEFYCECQTSFGGFSKFPGYNAPDLTHSYMGLCSIGLLGVKGVKKIFGPLGISLE